MCVCVCVCLCVCPSQVFLTNSSNVFLLEPCQDVAKLLDNQVEVCKGVLSIYRHMIMEHTMNTQTWSAPALSPALTTHNSLKTVLQSGSDAL